MEASLATVPNLAGPAPSTPPAGGTARQPIAVVRLDGVELSAVSSVRTTNVSHSSADQFEVELPLQVQPGTANWAAWGNPNTQAEIEVLYGMLDADGNRSALNSAVLGPVDNVAISQPENKVVLSGRDYSSRLIDTQTFQNFTNQTASEIAATIATAQGLTPMVQPTKLPVGTYNPLDNSYTRVTRRESAWDLLTQLARNEGFVCFVRGRNLFFQLDTAPTGQPYNLIWQPATSPGGSPGGNFKSLHLSRAITLARNIVVTVISHDPNTQKAVMATSSSMLTGQAAQGTAGIGPQTYTIDVPGLTQDQAMDRANQLRNGYSLFERVIDVQMPGDPFLSFEQPIRLSGTGTDWDQLYFADRIERSLSQSGGFTMSIRAKNHSASQTATTTVGAP
jgi:phage protein D